MRAIGVRGQNLGLLPEFWQLDLEQKEQKRIKMRDVDACVDALRNRFGNSCICRGVVMKDDKLKDLDPKTEHVIHPISYFG